MGSGTIIRLILAIIIIALPLTLPIIFNDNALYAFFVAYLFLPFLFIWEDACDCTDCIMTSYCEKSKRFNFVKKTMIFIGYDADKINSIPFPKNYDCENKYRSMYTYLKNNYGK